MILPNKKATVGRFFYFHAVSPWQSTRLPQAIGTMAIPCCTAIRELMEKRFKDVNDRLYSVIRFRRTMNSDPSPGALRTLMLPPEISSTRRASASPSPLPSPEWDVSP